MWFNDTNTFSIKHILRLNSKTYRLKNFTSEIHIELIKCVRKSDMLHYWKKHSNTPSNLHLLHSKCLLLLSNFFTDVTLRQIVHSLNLPISVEGTLS